VNADLAKCLDDLEARIDPRQEEQLEREWTDFSKGLYGSGIFMPGRTRPSAPGFEWPKVSVNAALADKDTMAIQQYGMCSQMLEAANGYIMNVRCNFGSSIIPLLFGVELFVMDEETNTLPTSWPLNDVDAIERIVDAGVPEIKGGFTEPVLEMGAFYADIAEHYPKIGRFVHIYHPDFQGPMDICEVVWGSSIFYAIYDQPELVQALLTTVTETYIRFMQAWLEVVPFRQGFNAHWGFFHKGNVMLRDDSAMNFSPDMFDQFIRPYDQRLLDEFGGGAIHFCGKGDHYIERLSQMDNVYAIHMSQPEYNDMETIYTHTVDKGINILGLQPEVAQASVAEGRDLCGRVHASRPQA
jgi:hypothetical protein